MFTWLRNRRRKQILAEKFPPHWDAILRKNVAHYTHLSPGDQAKLRDTVRILVAEKMWEPARGFHVTEEMKLTIAAQAALLLIGQQDHDYFATVASIIVYPGQFRRPDQEDNTYEDDLAEEIADGMATYRGPVVLAWNQVQPEARDPAMGYSVVVHEFAHQLDFRDEYTDGTPPLPSEAERKRWAGVMSAALKRHRAELSRGAETFFSEQAGDNETEFFADVAEAFFCTPADLREEDSAVYDLMRDFFGVDPVTWFPERRANL
ncbi:M90 family metallopeptidase [Limnoglobus roseus]|uniref:Protein MtfA n=1 Tax=Limnoglobus roseus TaxID=2598579 RepID=A0A5C1AQT8_9BACT|nr:M90 family metallopeptidase [Limnoglobus roseus]QEL20396.1 Protein MtfA [Limnoglobus roseus]